MGIVHLREQVILTFITVVVLTTIVSCSGEAGNGQALAPDVVTEVEPEFSVTMLVPPATGALFKMISNVALGDDQFYDIQIMEGDSLAAGVRAILDGKIDLMLIMRQPLPDEPVAFLEIFRTPVVILVNTELEINNLTREQASAIFSGEVTNWSQLGGPELEIKVFVQEADDTATVALREYLLGTTQFATSAQVLFDDRDIISIVNGLSGAVGYSPMASKKLIEQSDTTSYSTLVRLDGVAPDAPDYPIVGVVGLIYLPERQAELQPILDWALDFLDSDLGQMLQEQYGVNALTSPRMSPEGGDNENSN